VGELPEPPRRRRHHPLATPLLDLADIHFTGLHHGSRSDASTIVIAEAEAETASGQVSGEVLDAVADMASWLPR
jgi:malonyl CoA-acyl carrier protein transacylase